ncbi:hypothetical protein TeGR_g13826, partial [Tetraparma gracilis]
NVLKVPLDFPSSIDPEIESLIPNKFGLPPTMLGTPDRSACMYGIGLVAARDVADEELLVNYRFNPASREAWPAWYHPLEGEEGEDRDRWADLDVV